MQPASSLERPPLAAGLFAIAATIWLARPAAPPAPPATPAVRAAMCPRMPCASQLVTAGELGRAAFLFALEHRPECARAARELAVVYHVAMAPNTDPMEAFAAVQRAIAIDHRSFGGTLAELYLRRRAVAAAAARAYDARGLSAWAREARLFR